MQPGKLLKYWADRNQAVENSFARPSLHLAGIEPLLFASLACWEDDGPACWGSTPPARGDPPHTAGQGEVAEQHCGCTLLCWTPSGVRSSL